MITARIKAWLNDQAVLLIEERQLAQAKRMEAIARMSGEQLAAVNEDNRGLF